MAKNGMMRSDGILKHFTTALIIAVVFYIAFFSWMQHRRLVNGPWEITFATDAKGQPSLKIAENKLGITQEIDFPGQKAASSNLTEIETFEDAVTNLPFGQMIFQDPTVLPGTVTMRQFGHEIELLPRVLIIDKKEIPWGVEPAVQAK